MKNVEPTELIILPGFRDLIAPLTELELQALRESIQTERRIMAPAVVWKWRNLPILVDGHHRVQIAKELGLKVPVIYKKFSCRSEAREWMWRNQASRRNWSTFTKVASLITAIEPGLKAQGEQNKKAGRSIGSSTEKVRTDETLASMAGVGNKTVRYVREMIRKPHHLPNGEDDLERLHRGELPISTAHRKWKQNKEASEIGQSASEEKLSVPEENSGPFISIISGSAEAVSLELQEASVGLILTDAPYKREELDAYDELAEAAKRVLKPGGVLACMTGQRYLPEVLRRLSGHLDYVWTVSLLFERQTGQAPPIRPLGIRNRWKPILIFSKGRRATWQTFFEDVITGSQKDKRFDAHGQSVVEAKYLIEKLATPEDLIWDPMAGGGTTGAAAHELGRRVILSDKDPRKIAKMKDRFTVTTEPPEGFIPLGVRLYLEEREE